MATRCCLSASRWCLDQIANLGERHPGELMRVGRKLMAGLRTLAAARPHNRFRERSHVRRIEPFLEVRV